VADFIPASSKVPHWMQTKRIIKISRHLSKSMFKKKHHFYDPHSNITQYRSDGYHLSQLKCACWMAGIIILSSSTNCVYFLDWPYGQQLYFSNRLNTEYFVFKHCALTVNEFIHFNTAA